MLLSVIFCYCDDIALFPDSLDSGIILSLFPVILDSASIFSLLSVFSGLISALLRLLGVFLSYISLLSWEIFSVSPDGPPID